MDPDLSLLDSCKSGDIGEVERFLNEGISPNVQTSEGITPLQVSASNGWENLVSFLLSRGSQVDMPNKYGWTPLMHAAKHGHTSVISTLLKHRAKVNICNKLGLKPVVVAAWGGHLSAVKMLLEAGAILDHSALTGVNGVECDMTALMAASLQGHDAVLRMLLERGASVNHASPKTGLTPLMLAASNGHKQTVQILVEWGGDANKTNMCERTALDIATARSQREVKAYLEYMTINRPAVGNSKEVEILQAVRNGDASSVKQILQLDSSYCNSIDPQDGSTPLILSAMLGHIDIVRLLLSFGANIDRQDMSNGWTALMHAVFSRNIAIANYLLENGADINSQAKNGYTVLDLACLLDHADSAIVNTLNGIAETSTEQNTSESAVQNNNLATKFKKSSCIYKSSPRKSNQGNRLKVWIDSITHHFHQKKLSKLSSKQHDVSNVVPEIQLPDQSSLEDDVFDNQTFLHPNSPKATLSLSVLLSPNRHLSESLRKHSLEPISPPLLSSPLNEDQKGKRLPQRKLHQERICKGSNSVVALQTPRLLKHYCKRSTSGEVESIHPRTNSAISFRISRDPELQKNVDNNRDMRSESDKGSTLDDKSKFLPVSERESSFPTLKIEPNYPSSKVPIVFEENEKSFSDTLLQLLQGVSLQKYAQMFKDQEIDMEAFQYLTDEDLEELGIYSAASKQKLLEIIQAMQSTSGLSSI